MDRAACHEVVVVKDEHHLVFDAGQLIQQVRQNDPHRVCAHPQEFERASPDPGTNLLQRGDHVHPEPHRVIIGTIKRQPTEPLVLARTHDPLRK